MPFARSEENDITLALERSGVSSPYLFFESKRRTDPVWHGTVMDHRLSPPELVPDDEWTLFDYSSVQYAFRHDELFSSELYDENHGIGLLMGRTILAMAGKEHADHRNLVAKAFRRHSLARWEPTVVGPVVNELLDEIDGRDEVDLVKSLTFEFPTRVISTLLGLPVEDMELFRSLSFDLISIASNIEAGLKAASELREYFQKQIDQRRRRMTDDIIGDLVSAEIDGQRLSDEAIYSFLRLLLPAGLETTYRATGNLLYLLLTHGDQLDELRGDRRLIPAAIEEGLRFESPLVTVVRQTTRDVELDGVTIPAGAQVDLCMGSANRDESRWERSNEFDINRPRQASISFAGGIHQCLGMHLARMEMRVVLDAVLDRLLDLRLVGGEAEIDGLIFRSPNMLPVTFRSPS